jgi:hypothetical protein
MTEDIADDDGNSSSLELGWIVDPEAVEAIAIERSRERGGTSVLKHGLERFYRVQNQISHLTAINRVYHVPQTFLADGTRFSNTLIVHPIAHGFYVELCA